MGPRRTWAGTTISGLVAIGLSLYGVMSAPGWSPWWTFPILVLTILATVLTWPDDHGHAVVAGSTFVKGNVIGSSFDNVVTHGTETFVGGNAVASVFRDIRFNVVSRRWPSTFSLAVLAVVALAELAVLVLVRR